MSLKNAWIGETKSIQNWPLIFYTDIAYLLSQTEPDFIKHLASENKKGKAYRYFSWEFIRKIYINEFNKKTPIYILKFKVIPSQRRNSKPYILAVVYRNKPNEPSGYIDPANGACTSGILGTCNYVTGMLFLVEKGVQTGLTSPSETSVLYQWNLPEGQRVYATVKPVQDLVFEISVYTKPKSKLVKLEKRILALFSNCDKSVETRRQEKT